MSVGRTLPPAVRALLGLTRHADEPAPRCRDCLDQQIREELASLSRTQDIERYLAASGGADAKRADEAARLD